MFRKSTQVMLGVAALFAFGAFTSALAADQVSPPAGGAAILMWTPAQQAWGYRNMEKVAPVRTIRRGAHVHPLPMAKAQIDPSFTDGGKTYDTAAYMAAFRASGVLVIKDGKDEGNLEIKTDSEGKAVIDVIPTGSTVDVQVIADGFATFANTYDVKESNRAIEIRMIRPRAQVSTYVDTRGQAASRPNGVQEPTKPTGAMTDKPATKTKTTTVLPGTNTNPPEMHPDNQYPLEPAQPKQQPAAPPQL